MATQLALAHIEGQRRIRVAAIAAVEDIWGNLSGYDEGNLKEWLAQVLPQIRGSQLQAAALARAYVARATERPLAGIDINELIGAAARNGTPPETVYQRPFISLWSELGEGKLWADAAAVAADRARAAAAMDCQMAMRNTLGAIGRADGYIWGYQRVADSAACDFCLEVDGGQFTSEEPMPLHNFCGCGAEPVVYTRGVANSNALSAFNAQVTPPPAGVAVNEHGELGPMLGAPGDHFMDEAEAFSR
jgi:hypothetical protein